MLNIRVPAAPLCVALMAALSAALGANAARADTQIRDVRTDAKGTVVGERVTLVTASRLRIDDTGLSYIVDPAAGKLILLDHGTKTWRETKFASLSPAARADGKNAEWRRRQEAFAARVEPNPLIRVVPTEETRTIAGVAAKKVDIFAGARKVRESWHAAAVPNEEYANIVAKLTEMDPSLSQRRDWQITQHTSHLGYAVLVRDFERGLTVETKEIKKSPVPADRFAVPSGYRKLD